MDAGPVTVKAVAAILQGAKTVIWNGPAGIFEFDQFAAGTKGIAQAMADSSATTIVGGGDSAAAVEKLGFADRMTHISTRRRRRRWSFWKARHCPASPPCRINRRKKADLTNQEQDTMAELKPDAAASGTFTLGGDLTVRRMGFGAMRITGKGIWGDPKDPAEARRVLQRGARIGRQLH